MAGGGAQALSRSLDKVLEDAQLTGVLSLHNRNLKLFPPSASKFDLSDTVTADLARNRLTEVPVQICDYGSLESLFVYHNSIRFIPDAVQLLTTLTFLDLSKNQLDSIPGVLCDLPLEVLLLGHNRLDTLPKEIGNLAKSLMELDVSCNHMRSLPSQMGDLRKLRVLNARQNLLKELPFECVCRMSGLQYLDVSSNQLVHLPTELRQITTLIQLKVADNPLISPPAKECNRGCVHTFKWLEIEALRHQKRAKGLPDLDWPPYRSSSLNRKGRMVQSTIGNDLGGVVGRTKLDRRPRSSRYNTIGADSGYASTADENRWSQDLSLNGESARRSPVGEEAPPPPPACRAAPIMGLPPSGHKLSVPSTLTKSTPAPVLSTALNGMALNSNCLTSPQRKRVVGYQNGGGQHGHHKNGAKDDQSNDSFVEEVMSACSKIGEQTEQERVVGGNRLSGGYASSNEEGSPTPKATPNKPDTFPKQFQYGSSNSISSARSYGRQTSGESGQGNNVINGREERGPLSPVRQSPRTSTDSEKSLVKGGTPPRSMKSEDIQNIYTGGVSPARRPAPTPPPPPPSVPPLQLSNGIRQESNSGKKSPPVSATILDKKMFSSSLTNGGQPIIEEDSKVMTNGDVNNGQGKIMTSSAHPLITNGDSGNKTVAGKLSSGESADSKTSRVVENGTGAGAKKATPPAPPPTTTTPMSNGVFKKPFPPGSGCLGSGHQMKRSVSGGMNQNSKMGKPPTPLSSGPPSTSRHNSLSSSQSSLSSTASGSNSGRQKPLPHGLQGGSRSGSASSGTGRPRPSKAPPAPPTFKSTEKFTRPRDSLATAHSSALKRAMDPKTQMDLIQHMRRVLEERLGVEVPEDYGELGAALSDGVILCNLVNQIRVRAITTVHNSSPTMPTLSSAKCRRNVENFLMACRRLGVSENHLCTQADILDKKNVAHVAKAVVGLAKMAGSRPAPRDYTQIR